MRNKLLTFIFFILTGVLYVIYIINKNFLFLIAAIVLFVAGTIFMFIFINESNKKKTLDKEKLELLRQKAADPKNLFDEILEDYFNNAIIESTRPDAFVEGGVFEDTQTGIQLFYKTNGKYFIEFYKSYFEINNERFEYITFNTKEKIYNKIKETIR